MSRNQKPISVAAVLARTVAEGDHLRWVGVKKPGVLTLNNRSVRRAIYEAVHGKLRKGMQVSASCETEDCVHPDCLVARSKSKAQKGVVPTVERNLKIRASRRKGSKLDMQIVREIRSSHEGHTEIERRLGLPRGQAYRVRNHLTWADHTNPFAGLGAR